MIGEKRWKNKVVKHLIFRADSREEGDFSRSIGQFPVRITEVLESSSFRNDFS